jgi:hypothetical protein
MPELKKSKNTQNDPGLFVRKDKNNLRYYLHTPFGPPVDKPMKKVRLRVLPRAKG